MIRATSIGLAASLSLALVSPGGADELAVEAEFSETKVVFALKGPRANVTLSITGPNEFHATVSSKGAATLDLARFGQVDDGEYTYHLTAATEEPVKIRTPLDNGREGGKAGVKSAAASGTFLVKDGLIVTRKTASKPDVVGGSAGDDQD